MDDYIGTDAHVHPQPPTYMPAALNPVLRCKEIGLLPLNIGRLFTNDILPFSPPQNLKMTQIFML